MRSVGSQPKPEAQPQDADTGASVAGDVDSLRLSFTCGHFLKFEYQDKGWTKEHFTMSQAVEYINVRAQALFDAVWLGGKGKVVDGCFNQRKDVIEMSFDVRPDALPYDVIKITQEAYRRIYG